MKSVTRIQANVNVVPDSSDQELVGDTINNYSIYHQQLKDQIKLKTAENAALIQEHFKLRTICEHLEELTKAMQVNSELLQKNEKLKVKFLLLHQSRTKDEINKSVKLNASITSDRSDKEDDYTDDH